MLQGKNDLLQKFKNMYNLRNIQGKRSCLEETSRNTEEHGGGEIMMRLELQNEYYTV